MHFHIFSFFRWLSLQRKKPWWGRSLNNVDRSGSSCVPVTAEAGVQGHRSLWGILCLSWSTGFTCITYCFLVPENSSREICKLNFCMNFCCLGCHQLSLELGFWQGMSLSRGMKENWSNCGCLHHSIRVSFILFVLCLSRVLRFALNSCLYFALCGSVGEETSQDLCLLAKLCGSGAAPLIFSCLSGLMGCQDPSHQLQRGLWVSSTPMKNLVLAYCAVSKRL